MSTTRTEVVRVLVSLDFFVFLVYVLYHVPSVHSLPYVTPEDGMSLVLELVCHLATTILLPLLLVYLLVNCSQVDDDETTTEA